MDEDLGPAHLPAVVGIAAAAVVALTLLVITARSRGSAETPRPVDMVTTLWQWATIENAYAPADDSHAAVPGTAIGEDKYNRLAHFRFLSLCDSTRSLQRCL